MFLLSEVMIVFQMTCMQLKMIYLTLKQVLAAAHRRYITNAQNFQVHINYVWLTLLCTNKERVLEETIKKTQKSENVIIS